MIRRYLTVGARRAHWPRVDRLYVISSRRLTQKRLEEQTDLVMARELGLDGLGGCFQHPLLGEHLFIYQH